MLPPGQARRDREIICELATAVGHPMTYASSAEVNDEMRGLTPSYAGISHARLEAGAQFQWPYPLEDHPGTPVLHRETFTRGLGQFHPAEYQPATEETDASFPIVLTTGRMLEHYHTGTMTRRRKGLHGLVPGPFVEVNGADAKKIRVKDGVRCIALAALNTGFHMVWRKVVVVGTNAGLPTLRRHTRNGTGTARTNQQRTAREDATIQPARKIMWEPSVDRKETREDFDGG